jgi:hypothetical protein
VKWGGCSGFSYSLDLTESKGEHDEEIELHGIKCIVDPKSYLYLNGVTLDFRDEVMAAVSCSAIRTRRTPRMREQFHHRVGRQRRVLAVSRCDGSIP